MFLRTGETDCHSQCAHWLRNDRGFYMACGRISGGRTGASAPTEMSEHLRRAACPHAAVMVRWLTGGGLRAARPTEAYFAVRRGGALPLPRATARVAPTEGYKQYRGRDDVGIVPYGYITRGAVRNSAPFRQGGRGDGLPRALRALAMTHYKMRYKPGGRTGFAMAGEFYMGRGGRMNVGRGMKKERTALSAPTGF